MIEPDSTQWPKSVRVAAAAFKSCTSSTNDQATGKSVLHAIASLRVGGWPIITPNWAPGNAGNSIEETIATLEAIHDVPTLLSSMVDTDTINVSANALYIDQGTLGLGARQFYIQPIFRKTLAAYTNLIAKVALVLGQTNNVTLSPAKVMNQAEAIVAYETVVARRMSAPTDRRNMKALFNVFSYSQLTRRWGNFDWANYFTHMLSFHNPQVVVPFLTGLGPRLVIAEPGYIDQLHKDLFLNPKTVYNYLIWRMVYANIQFIPAVQKHYEDFLREFDGSESLPPPVGACAGMIINYMPFAAGNIYVTQYFNPAARQDVQGMIANVIAAYSSMLNRVSWMDQQTLNAAQKKRASILQNIGYPNWILNGTQLDIYYKSIVGKLNGISDWWSVRADLKQDLRMHMYQMLGQPNNRAYFLMSPATVNAWYQPERNSITFPAAILNPPFYSVNYPKVVNYGAMGMVMGHELSHGFDDQGSQYDYSGTLAPWMTPKSRLGFANMTQCLIRDRIISPSLQELLKQNLPTILLLTLDLANFIIPD